MFTLSRSALEASRILDDALRQYLSENGGQNDVRAPIVRAANRAVRLRAAAELIADVMPPPLGVYPRARELLQEHADAVCAEGAARQPISDDFVLALRAEAGDNDLAVSAALPLLTVAAHLGELELLYPRG